MKQAIVLLLCANLLLLSTYAQVDNRNQSITPAGDPPGCALFATKPDTTVAAGTLLTLRYTGFCFPGNIYKWQVSTTGVAPFVNIAGADSISYIFVPTLANNGNKYRFTYQSPGGVLHTLFPFSLGVVNSLEVCRQAVTSFKVGFTGTSYQWQLATDTGYMDLSNNSVYSGVLTDSLSITNPPADYYGHVYRCVVVVPGTVTTAAYTLLFQNTWTGAVNNDWFNPANWSCPYVPDGYTDVTVSGNTNPVVSANSIVRTLKVVAPASIIISAGVQLDILH